MDALQTVTLIAGIIALVMAAFIAGMIVESKLNN